MLSRIGHPNIVRVFDANIIESEQGVCGYFTMEHITGGSLDKFRRSLGPTPMSVEIAMDVMKQVCRGIAQAHREKPPIIHRDIKPQNILVGHELDGLRARVSDFGLAKKVNPLTLLATAAGTLAFKPPEVFSQHKSDSCAADVWALGATLYVLLTDHLPYAVPTDATWHTPNLFKDDLVSPTEYRPDVNTALSRIILKALEKDPEHRYPSAVELLDAFENWDPDEREHRGTVASGGNASGNSQTAEALVTRALQAKLDDRLNEAAELMEQALEKSPSLSAKYGHQVKLWRRGISM